MFYFVCLRPFGDIIYWETHILNDTTCKSQNYNILVYMLGRKVNVEGTQILRIHEPKFHSDMDRVCQRHIHPWDMRA